LSLIGGKRLPKDKCLRKMVSKFTMGLVNGKKEILYRAKTPFNDILVTQEKNIITLWSPPTVKQTAIDVSNPVLPYLEYVQNILLGLAFHPNPKSILILGLGGGSLPMILANINKRTGIDVVEIDPDIAVVAKKYFHFITTPRLQLFIDDASLFIKKSVNNYDLIILDAYIGNKLPQTLSTLEFFIETNRRLSLRGIFIVNLMTSDKLHFKKMLNRVGSVFRELWLLPGKTSNNTIAFATNAKLSQAEIARYAQLLQKDLSYDFQLARLTVNLNAVK